MEPDGATAAFLKAMEESGAPKLYEQSVGEARESLKQATLAVDVAEAPVARVEDRTIPRANGPGPNREVPVRLCWPEGGDGPLGLLIMYHGGGWTLGDIDSHSNICRYYCHHAGVAVMNVGYGLAPEHKFPQGPEDCYAALCWAAANAGDLGVDAARIAVTGDSAGGNLAAVVCQMAKSRGGPAVALQVLVYPAMDLREGVDDLYPTRASCGGGQFFLSIADMDWLSGHYFSDRPGQAGDLRASPILAEDFSGLPAALVVTAGLDPLCAEGKMYADRLAEAGVAAEYKCFEGTIHGFMSFSGAIPAGLDGLALVADRTRQAIG